MATIDRVSLHAVPHDATGITSRTIHKGKVGKGGALVLRSRITPRGKEDDT